MEKKAWEKAEDAELKSMLERADEIVAKIYGPQNNSFDRNSSYAVLIAAVFSKMDKKST